MAIDWWNIFIQNITEFVQGWLSLFGINDPAYVKFGMALVAGFALLMVVAVVLGVLGAIIDTLKQ